MIDQSLSFLWLPAFHLSREQSFKPLRIEAALMSCYFLSLETGDLCPFDLGPTQTLRLCLELGFRALVFWSPALTLSEIC